MYPESLNDIIQFQKDCQDEMREKIENFEETFEAALEDIHNKVYGPLEED